LIAAIFETIVFIYSMNSVRRIKQELNILPEMQTFAISWLLVTNLILFLSI